MPRAPDWVVARVLVEERNTLAQQEELTTPGVSPDTIITKCPRIRTALVMVELIPAVYLKQMLLQTQMEVNCLVNHSWPEG